MKIHTSIFAASLIFSAGAMADHDRRTDYAKVVAADPIVEHVRVATPRQECWDEEVAHHDRGYRSATPTLIGSVIGGVLGNELGHHKDAKRAGVVVGALLGGSIGRDIGRRYQPQGGTYYATEQVCRTFQDYHEEERIVGYDVTYKYHGNIYHTRTAEHPGKRIPVRVAVTPVERWQGPRRYRD